MGEQTSKLIGSSTPGALFNLTPRRPTTRRLADLIRRHRGSNPSAPPALPDGTHRADDADYQEVTCRSALNRVTGMPFRWTLNPYRGCTHGCHYCFARRYQTHLELGIGDEFSSVILVKVNFADVLRRELARPAWQRELIGFGTATDPYQPIEGHYRLTRRSLEALVDHPSPVGIVTKGPMVVRDVDLLVELSRLAACTVHMSVPTVDEDAWRALEPGTAHPPPAAARGPRTGRCRGRRRCPHGAGRAGSHLTAGEDRTDHQGNRRPRRPVLRRDRDALGGRHTRPLHALSVAGVPRPRAADESALRGQVRPTGLPGPGARCVGADAPAIRAAWEVETVTDTKADSRPGHPGRSPAAVQVACVISPGTSPKALGYRLWALRCVPEPPALSGARQGVVEGFSPVGAGDDV